MSNNQVYVIVKVGRETYGHGDFGSSVNLAMRGMYGSGGPHPAFTTKQSAREYVRGLGESNFGLEVMPLELHDAAPSPAVKE